MGKESLLRPLNLQTNCLRGWCSYLGRIRLLFELLVLPGWKENTYGQGGCCISRYSASLSGQGGRREETPLKLFLAAWKGGKHCWSS